MFQVAMLIGMAADVGEAAAFVTCPHHLPALPGPERVNPRRRGRGAGGSLLRSSRKQGAFTRRLTGQQGANPGGDWLPVDIVMIDSTLPIHERIQKG
jgi:hypothetical protein